MGELKQILTHIAKARRTIALRAKSAVGVHFRLHGRSVETGLDCVGLVAYAAAPLIHNHIVPQNYNLRFDNINIPFEFFADSHFVHMGCQKPYEIGDIILVKPSPQQLHFIINIGPTIVHAHSGLRRIVESNHPILSPVCAVWRYKGA